MGDAARGMAFRTIVVILIGTAIGSLLPETGNVAAYLLDLPEGQAHVFNPVFLVLSIVGIGLALYLGYQSRK